MTEAAEPKSNAPAERLDDVRQGSPPLTGMWWLLLGATFSIILIEVCLLLLWPTDTSTLPGLGPIQVISVTIAVFAVNFGLLQYSFSPYNQVLNSLPVSQIASSLVVMFLGITPVVVSFVVGEATTLRIAAHALPILAASSVALVAFSGWQVNPKVLLQKKASTNALEAFFRDFAAHYVPIVEYDQEFESRYEDYTGAIPHEWDYVHHVEITGDNPFRFLRRLTHVALAEVDIDTVNAIVQPYVEALRIASDIELPELEEGVREYHLRSALRKTAVSEISRFGDALKSKAGRIVEFEHVHNNLWERVLQRARSGDYMSNDVSVLKAVATTLSLEFIRSGRGQVAYGPLKIVRRLIETAVRVIGLDPMDSQQLHNHCYTFQICGSAAVDAKDAQYLYRCFETLEWLGCTAAQLRRGELMRVVLEILAQLAREARYADLQCFWDKCTLPPHIHAEERIDTIFEAACAVSLEHFLAEQEKHQPDPWDELFSEKDLNEFEDIGELRDFLRDRVESPESLVAHDSTETIDEDEKPKYYVFGTPWFEEAYARIWGVGCEITARLVDDIPHINKRRLKPSHKYSFAKSGRVFGYGNDLDYSDFSMLKPMRLDGFGGRIFQGPPVKLTSMNELPTDTESSSDLAAETPPDETND